MVQEGEDKVIGILVLVPVLERENLEHCIGEDIRYPDGHPGLASPVKALALDDVLGEVVTHELGTADIEGPESGSRVFTPGPEDPARFHLVRLAEELDEDEETVDVAGPAEARLPRPAGRSRLSRLFCSVRYVSGVSSPRARPITRSTSVVPTWPRVPSGSSPTRYLGASPPAR